MMLLQFSPSLIWKRSCTMVHHYLVVREHSSTRKKRLLVSAVTVSICPSHHCIQLFSHHFVSYMYLYQLPSHYHIQCHYCLQCLDQNVSIARPPDKSVYQKIIFLISHPKHMLWVLKRTVSMRQFF